jgi:hypothetical protein
MVGELGPTCGPEESAEGIWRHPPFPAARLRNDAIREQVSTIGIILQDDERPSAHLFHPQSTPATRRLPRLHHPPPPAALYGEALAATGTRGRRGEPGGNRRWPQGERRRVLTRTDLRLPFAHACKTKKHS